MSNSQRPKPQRCRSCGASIYWATSDATGKLSAQVLGKDAQVEPGRNRYTSHHATCPNAAQHRRRR